MTSETAKSHSAPSDIPTFISKSPVYSSYASVSQSFPKRDQGLIMQCMDGLTLTDYTCTIGNLLTPKNIISSAKISHNRICIFLTRKELVNEITEKHESLVIKGKNVSIRPLVAKNKRIIFSNVQTNIPNYVFEDILDQLGVKRNSPVSILRANIDVNGYEHVLSTRRQVYIKNEDIQKIPEMFRINHDEINYFIFAGTDALRCFSCNLDGHLAKNCPTIVENTTKPSDTITQSGNVYNSCDQNETNRLNETITNNITFEPTQPNILEDPSPPSQLPLNEYKRTHSEISTNESPSEASLKDDYNIIKPKPSKKGKTVKENEKPEITNLGAQTANLSNLNKKSEDMDKKLENIKERLNQPHSLLKYDQFKSLMESIQNVRNPIQIVHQYTLDTEAFGKFIKEEVYPYVNNRSIKMRCTTLLKNINKLNFDHTPQLTPVNSDDDTDANHTPTNKIN